MNVENNFKKIKENIPENIDIVAVSKTKPTSDILKLYNIGHKIFGENKVQELLAKKEILPDDIQWHMIGALQSNKVKYLVPFISMIHSIDSFKLLYEVNKRAAKIGRKIKCLLEFHIAEEDSKHGFEEKEIFEMLDNKEFWTLNNIEVAGLMGIATHTDDKDKIRNEFRYLKNLFSKIKEKYYSDNINFKELSMGMTSDYTIAIEEGATIVRIGSAIFGARNYSK